MCLCWWKKWSSGVNVIYVKVAGMFGPTSEALWNCTYNGIVIESADEYPIPWDADIISSMPESITLVGGVGPGGYGCMTVQLPRKDVDTHYQFYVEPKPGKREEVLKLLAEIGVVAA